MDWLKKYWWLIALAVVVIAVVYFGSKAPSSTAGTTLIDSNGDGKGDTAFNPRPYTDSLKATIDSRASWWTLGAYRDTKPYQDLLALSNPQLKAVADDWQSRYYKENNESLLQAINGEFLSSDILTPINARFRALNIS